MKTLMKGIFGLGLITLLFSCDTKEKQALRDKVDSLNVKLEASAKTQQTLDEVGVLIDSIDANRRALNTKIVEGTSYSDYISRLKDINTHIRDLQIKLDRMEETSQHANRASAAAINRLKTDLELRSKEILALQVDIANMRDENKNLTANISHKDSLLSGKDEMIKVKEGDIASLQGLVKDTNDQNQVKVANLYFQQAQALETAANRTKFAPRKKKETMREALELYKLSMSLGKTEAQQKIDELEKKLS